MGHPLLTRHSLLSRCTRRHTLARCAAAAVRLRYWNQDILWVIILRSDRSEFLLTERRLDPGIWISLGNRPVQMSSVGTYSGAAIGNGPTTSPPTQSAISAATGKPLLDAPEIQVSDRDEGRIARAGGGGSHGERVPRTRDASGAVKEVCGWQRRVSCPKPRWQPKRKIGTRREVPDRLREFFLFPLTSAFLQPILQAFVSSSSVMAATRI